MVEESFCVGCGHVITMITVGCRVDGDLCVTGDGRRSLCVVLL